MAEVHHFQEVGCIIAQVNANIQRLEMQKWEAGHLQEASIHCLESTNTLERLEQAQLDHHMHTIEHADTVVCHGHHSKGEGDLTFILFVSVGFLISIHSSPH